MEKLQTKHDEIRFKTSTLEEMNGQFLAERLIRTWHEDFVDEDNGEVVSIPRNEIILERGTLIDNYNLQTISFHLSSGDIKEVEISNQKRDGVFTDNTSSTWCVTAYIGGKKKNLYLYANSIYKALEISSDFIEQTYPGRFGILNAKELDFANLITNVSQENEGELKFYRIEVQIEKEDNSYNREFIVKAMDAENAKAIIEAFLTNKFQEENDYEEFMLTLQSAKVVPCEAVIDVNFCMRYLDNGETH